MRTFFIAAALAASAALVGTPASAQPHPQQQGYGYHDNHGQTRRLLVRIDQLQRQIVQLDRRNILSEREARRLRTESHGIEQRLRYARRDGLNGRERQAIEQSIRRLEVRINREARDGNHWRR